MTSKYELRFTKYDFDSWSKIVLRNSKIVNPLEV